jgi:hypothetical protein
MIPKPQDIDVMTFKEIRTDGIISPAACITGRISIHETADFEPESRRSFLRRSALFAISSGGLSALDYSAETFWALISPFYHNSPQPPLNLRGGFSGAFPSPWVKGRAGGVTPKALDSTRSLTSQIKLSYFTMKIPCSYPPLKKNSGRAAPPKLVSWELRGGRVPIFSLDGDAQ